MVYQETCLEIVLNAIEEKLHLTGNDLSSPSDWNFELNLPVQDIINKSPKEADKIKYIIKTFEVMNYIKFKHGDYSIIENITSSGLKYLFFQLHEIDFKY